jgi:hypothetical protein
MAWAGCRRSKIRPSCRTISSDAQLSMEDACWTRYWRACRATTYSAEPPTTVPRVDPVPPPDGTMAVSPCNTRTRSGVTPSASATICAKAVSEPWPWGETPVRATMDPDGSIVSHASRRGSLQNHQTS